MNNHNSHIPRISKDENQQYGYITPDLVRMVAERVYEMMRRDLIVENERKRPLANQNHLRKEM